MPGRKRSARHHKGAIQRARKPRVGIPRIADRLSAWYDANHRELPWRTKPGQQPDPYRVWLSEIMLQQTTVKAVIPYYRAFLKRWPNVSALAKAPLDEVLGAWAGLGYYARARNLHRAAKAIVLEGAGAFPATAAELRRLPGIGSYTAAAIAAIAFGERVAAMDANAERVIARLFAFRQALPKARRQLALMAAALVPAQRPGNFAQALMDLGSQICTLKNPLCGECPIARHCRARAMGIQQELPRKATKRERPVKRGAAFVAFDASDAVYLVRRPEEGLLGAMLQPPLSGFAEAFPVGAVVREIAPFEGNWVKKSGFIRHVFTHFVLELEVWAARFDLRPNGGGKWVPPERLKDSALPSVMRKAIAHARESPDPSG